MSGNEPEPPAARWARAEIEVVASPDDVWQAVASDATATVTTWDPPHRFGYEEPLRAADGSVAAAPLATEILVEARSGGSCVVRVVCGLHHDGDGWEGLIDGAGQGWRMSLTVLRSYLRHFGGQPAAHVNAIGTVGWPLGDQATIATAVMRRVGIAGRSAGERFRTPADAPLLAGSIEHLSSAWAAPPLPSANNPAGAPGSPAALEPQPVSEEILHAA